MAFQLLIVREGTDDILVQKFFKRKLKAEKVEFEFAGCSIKGFIASYLPLQNSLVIFVIPDDKEQP